MNWKEKSKPEPGVCLVENCLAPTKGPQSKYCDGHRKLVQAAKAKEIWDARKAKGEGSPNADIRHLTFNGELSDWAREHPDEALDHLLAGNSMRNKIAPQLFLELLARYFRAPTVADTARKHKKPGT